jgi:VRR-NUC domain/Helix-turn-helix domain
MSDVVPFTTLAERVIQEELKKAGYTVYRHGWPDFLAIEGGRARGFGVEVKAGNDKVSRWQEQMHEALRSLGLPVYVVHVDDLNRPNWFELRSHGFRTPEPRQQPEPSHAVFLTVEDVARRYNTSVKAIHDRTRRNEIPFTKRPGFRRLLFDRRHLDHWDAGAGLEVVDLPGGGKIVRPT